MSIINLKNRNFFSLFVLLACILFHQQVNAQASDDKNSSIKGRVTSANGDPMPGVNVTLPQLNRGTTTDANGKYQISKVPAGSYKITFSFIGYAAETRRITIRDGQSAKLDVALNEQTIHLGNLTVTGVAYASDPLTSPADIDVLAGERKFATQQTSLGASLDQMAGISTISTGAQVGKPVIRGLSGSRVQVLDEGVSMDFQQFGVRHTAPIDPFMAERIEVVSGAASVQYGSSALGGAVNVISHQVPDAINRQGFLSGEVLGVYATNNEEVTGGLHLDGAIGGFGITGTIIRRNGGLVNVPEVPTFKESKSNSAPKFVGELPYTDFDQLNGNVAVGYRGGFGQITTEYTRWTNEYNFLLPNGKGLGQNLENNKLQFKSEFRLGNNFTLKPGFSYNENLRQSNKKGQPLKKLPKDGPAYLDLLRKSYTANINIEHPPVGDFAGNIGLSYNYQDQVSRGTGSKLVPSGTINNWGAFFFEKAEFRRFTLSLGARFDYRTQEAEPSKELKLPNYDAGETTDVLKQEYTAFSGSIGATYQFTNHFVVASTVSRGFRAPSLFNLHAYGKHGGVAAFQIGDPGLEPEYSLNTDFSLRWRSQDLTAEVTAYRNAIQNYIFLVNTGEFTGPNSKLPILRTTQGNARLLGINASMHAHLATWFQIDGTFEIVKGKNVDEDIENVDELPLLPPTKLGGGIKFTQSNMGPLQNPYLRIGVEHAFEKKAAGRYEPFWQFGPAFPFGRASTEAYTLLNAGIGFQLDLNSQPISFTIQAKNILNEAYRNFLDTYKGYTLSPGRNITFRVKVPFKLL